MMENCENMNVNISSFRLNYVSCIKIDGIPILPPLLTEEDRQEMRRYRALAIKIQEKLNRLKSSCLSDSSFITDSDTIDDYSSSSIISYTDDSTTKFSEGCTDVLNMLEDKLNDYIEEPSKDMPKTDIVPLSKDCDDCNNTDHFIDRDAENSDIEGRGDGKEMGGGRSLKGTERVDRIEKNGDGNETKKNRYEKNMESSGDGREIDSSGDVKQIVDCENLNEIKTNTKSGDAEEFDERNDLKQVQKCGDISQVVTKENTEQINTIGDVEIDKNNLIQIENNIIRQTEINLDYIKAQRQYSHTIENNQKVFPDEILKLYACADDAKPTCDTVISLDIDKRNSNSESNDGYSTANENLDETKSPSRLIRSRSFILDKPSPFLLAQLEKQKSSPTCKRKTWVQKPLIFCEPKNINKAQLKRCSSNDIAKKNMMDKKAISKRRFSADETKRQRGSVTNISATPTRRKGWDLINAREKWSSIENDLSTMIDRHKNKTRNKFNSLPSSISPSPTSKMFCTKQKTKLEDKPPNGSNFYSILPNSKDDNKNITSVEPKTSNNVPKSSPGAKNTQTKPVRVVKGYITPNKSTRINLFNTPKANDNTQTTPPKKYATNKESYGNQSKALPPPKDSYISTDTLQSKELIVVPKPMNSLLPKETKESIRESYQPSSGESHQPFFRKSHHSLRESLQSPPRKTHQSPKKPQPAKESHNFSKEQHQSPSKELHQSPPKELHQSPPRELHQFPPKELHQSPPKELHQSPPKELHQSPPKELNRSPKEPHRSSKETHKFPVKEPHRSPPRQQYQSPPRQQYQSPKESHQSSRQSHRSRESRQSLSRESNRSPLRELHQSPSRESHQFQLSEPSQSLPRKSPHSSPRKSYQSSSRESYRSPPREPQSLPRETFQSPPGEPHQFLPIESYQFPPRETQFSFKEPHQSPSKESYQSPLRKSCSHSEVQQSEPYQFRLTEPYQYSPSKVYLKEPISCTLKESQLSQKKIISPRPVLQRKINYINQPPLFKPLSPCYFVSEKDKSPPQEIPGSPAKIKTDIILPEKESPAQPLQILFQIENYNELDSNFTLSNEQKTSSEHQTSDESSISFAHSKSDLKDLFNKMQHIQKIQLIELMRRQKEEQEMFLKAFADQQTFLLMKLSETYNQPQTDSKNNNMYAELMNTSEKLLDECKQILNNNNKQTDRLNDNCDLMYISDSSQTVFSSTFGSNDTLNDLDLTLHNEVSSERPDEVKSFESCNTDFHVTTRKVNRSISNDSLEMEYSTKSYYNQDKIVVNIQKTVCLEPKDEKLPKKKQYTTEQIRAASIINAACRGYLIRRLFKSERVQNLIQTIKDTLLCAMELHHENVESIQPADIELHRRLIQQVTAACTSFHDIFFKLSLKEQLAVIALDRQRKKERLLKPTLVKSPSLSSTTQKRIEKKLKRDNSADYSSSSNRSSFSRSCHSADSRKRIKSFEHSDSTQIKKSNITQESVRRSTGSTGSANKKPWR